MKVDEHWVVKRTKNEWPKKWPGPWFKFGTADNLTGKAHYSVLATYIGGEAYAKVHDHFKCTRGISHSVIVGGPVATNLGVPNNTQWDFPKKKSEKKN